MKTQLAEIITAADPPSFLRKFQKSLDVSIKKLTFFCLYDDDDDENDNDNEDNDDDDDEDDATTNDNDISFRFNTEESMVIIK